jgi:dolichol-phosphate mannosyltransferase
MPRPPWIVLPTYDEAASLPAVLSGIAAALPGARVLVVDDASPDGTAAVARSLGAEVLDRPRKLGLGPAYVAGFRRALAHGAPVVVGMDADGSHDPRDLPRLLAALDGGADLALGSRYVAGSGVADWPPARRVVSRVGCASARLLLRVPVRDLTGGFKAFRAEALEAIDYASVRSHGYAFQVELTYSALRAGLRVHELPIVFHERRAGVSKMTPRIALEAAWRIPLLGLTSRPRRRLPMTSA